MANRFNDPNMRMAINNVVAPRGAISGTKNRNIATTMAANVDRPSRPMPTAVSIVSGVLLNENIPFFAHSTFLSRLLVEVPNMRSGRT